VSGHHDAAPRARRSGRHGLRRLRAFLLALSPAPPREPEPYAGHLADGRLVRAILEASRPYLQVVHRPAAGPAQAEQVELANARGLDIPAGGVMAVLRVRGSSTYHDPRTESGYSFWWEVFECDLVTLERSEEDAVRLARECAGASGRAGKLDLERPRARGPGPHGGWIVRLERPGAPRGAPGGIEFEIDAAGLCWDRL
jgi:hypothetical protein